MTFDEWRKQQKHLPDFMRDFHDQKDLFKALFEVAMEGDNEGQIKFFEGLNWQNTHVYTIDIFLWVLAAHGYTLQKNRSDFEFGDISGFISRRREERANKFHEQLQNWIGERKNVLSVKNYSDNNPRRCPECDAIERTHCTVPECPGTHLKPPSFPERKNN